MTAGTDPWRFWLEVAQYVWAVECDRERQAAWYESYTRHPPESGRIFKREKEERLMPIIAKAGGGSSFRPVSAGLHPAVCSAVIDLGVQEGTERFPKPKHKVHLRWSCLDEEVEWVKNDVQHKGPAIVGQTFTLSLNENSKLRPLLEAWRGRKFSDAELAGFDIAKLAGVPCQVQIVHETRGDRTYAQVQAVVGWPKGQPVPHLAEAPVVYSCAEPDDLVFGTLPEWLQTLIRQRVADDYEDLAEKHGIRGHAAAAGVDDEEVPF